MFKRKYRISILTSKWEIVKKNIKLTIIPRKDEFVFLDGQYYEVINVVHSLDKNQEIFVIINELPINIKI